MAFPTVRPTASVLRERSVSTARRLVSGAGMASFVAYRHDPERAVAVAAHGVTASGDLVLALLGDSAPCPTHGSLDVRVDIHREATEAQVRILSASAHMLATLTWLSPTDVAGALATGALPEAVAVVAQVPGAALAVVTGDRLVLHDGSGVTPLDYAEVAAETSVPVYPGAAGELEAHEAVASLPEGTLFDVFSAVTRGALPGAVLSERAVTPTCAASIGAVYIVDVDGHGLTLMHVGTAATSVVFAAFTEPAPDAATLRVRLAGLLPSTRS